MILKSRIYIIGLAFAWAGWIFFVATIANLSLPSAPGSDYTLANSFKGFEQLISPLVRFDSAHYMEIARNGYPDDPTGLKVFFPLYPLLLSVLAMPFDVVMSQTAALMLAGLTLNVACLMAAVCLLIKLFGLDTTKENAKWAGLLVLASPFAFFFVALYTESLFLLLVVAAFYAARTGRWWLAGGLGALASFTRLPGVFVALALAVEYLHQRGWQWRRVRADALAVPLAGLGAAAYFGYLHFNGGIGRYQEAYSIGWPERVTDFNIFATLWRPIGDYLNGGGLQMNEILALGSVGLAVLIVTLSWRRMRPAYLAFVLPSMVLPLLTTTLDSVSRYYMLLFPLYLYAVLLVRDKSYLVAAVLASGMLSGLLIALFTNGYFVA